MLPVRVVVVLDVEALAVEFDTVNEALVVVAVDAFTFVGDAGGSEIGEEGGEVFMSSKSGDLLVASILGAPFKAELLANCR